MNGPSKHTLTRRIALAAGAGLLLSVWAFPVLWALLTSFKSERDVLAYPPVIFFEPTLAHYREVLFGASSILPNLWSSVVVASSATPAPLLDQINADVRKVMEAPVMKEKLAKMGVEYASMNRAQFWKVVEEEITRSGKIIREQKLTAE